MDEMKKYVFYVKETNLYFLRAKDEEDAWNRWDNGEAEIVELLSINDIELKESE